MILCMLIGGVLLLLSLPLLSPLIVGTVIVGAIRGVYVSAQRVRSGRHR